MSPRMPTPAPRKESTHGQHEKGSLGHDGGVAVDRVVDLPHAPRVNVVHPGIRLKG